MGYQLGLVYVTGGTVEIPVLWLYPTFSNCIYVVSSATWEDRTVPFLRECTEGIEGLTLTKVGE